MDFDELRIDVAESRELVGLVLRGAEAQIGTGHGLRLSARLEHEGKGDLARRLFDASEPLDFLSGALRGEGSGDYRMLQERAESAWLFRPLSAVVDALGQVRMSARSRPGLQPRGFAGELDENGDGEDDTVRWAGPGAGLSVTLARSLAGCGAFGKLDEFEAEMALRPGALSAEAALQFDTLRVIAAAEERIARELGGQALARVLARYPPKECDPGLAVYVAWLATLLPGNRATIAPYVARAPASLLVHELTTAREARDSGNLDPSPRSAHARCCWGCLTLCPSVCHRAVGQAR